MMQYAKSYELKNKAKDKLGGKYGMAIGVSLLGTLIPGAIRMLANMLFSPLLPSAAVGSQGAALLAPYLFSAVLSLALSIVLGIFDIGLCLFFLNMACGQPYSVKDLFYGFREDFVKSLSLSGTLAIINALCLYPHQYLLDHFRYTGQYPWLYFSIAAMVIGFCIYIPASLTFSLSYYLMLDFPDRSALSLLRQSARIMRGHKRRLFYIEMSFLPLMGLCLLTVYVGFLWLMPYMYMTQACFFLDIMAPKN